MRKMETRSKAKAQAKAKAKDKEKIKKKDKMQKKGKLEKRGKTEEQKNEKTEKLEQIEKKSAFEPTLFLAPNSNQNQQDDTRVLEQRREKIEKLAVENNKELSIVPAENAAPMTKKEKAQYEELK